MSSPDGSLWNVLGLLAIGFLVLANGFFVAAEFSLVAVRRTRVTELVAAGRTNAVALQRSVSNLDANLAACQLGITMSRLAGSGSRLWRISSGRCYHPFSERSRWPARMWRLS